MTWPRRSHGRANGRWGQGQGEVRKWSKAGHDRATRWPGRWWEVEGSGWQGMAGLMGNDAALARSRPIGGDTVGRRRDAPTFRLICLSTTLSNWFSSRRSSHDIVDLNFISVRLRTWFDSSSAAKFTFVFIRSAESLWSTNDERNRRAHSFS